MSGYGGPTTDPWDAIKQRQQREHEAAQEANRPGRTQTFQSVRKLWNAILELRTLVDQMVELFNRMPQNGGAQVDEAGFNLPVLTWVKVAEATIPRPSVTNRAAVTVTVVAAINGRPSPILQPLMQGRIRINGFDGEPVKLATVYGRSTSEVATCRGSFGLFHELTSLTQDVKVELWLHLASMEELFTIDSQAALSVSVGFTRVGS